MEYISLYHAKIITELGMKSSKEGHLRAPFGLFFSLMYCFLIFCQTLSFWLSPQTDQQQRIGNTAAGLVHRALDGAYYLICSQNFSRREARQRFLGHWRSWPHLWKLVLIIFFLFSVGSSHCLPSSLA